MIRTVLSAAALAATAALPVSAQDGDASGDGDFTLAARADVMDRDGSQIGTVSLNTTASGVTLVIVALNGLPEGGHGIHIHETGDCSADDFTSAGGHVAGDAQHGIFVDGGPHPGDLPNAIVGADGNLNLEIFNPRLEIDEMIFDDDGAAFIVHADPDDYKSQPAGAAGDRIACGVFERG